MVNRPDLGRRRPADLRPVTLRDVAARATVSEITVSRVLRGVGPTTADTRARVLAAVEALGYVPNRVAGTLASAVSSLVGVIVPSFTNNVFADVLRGIHAGLESTGIQPVIGLTDYDVVREEAMVASLLAWQPAALLVAGFEHTAVTRRRLNQSGIRVAELMDIDGHPVDLAVGFSHRAAGYATGRHLVRRGYRRFGYVGHDLSWDHRARLRRDGLEQALGEAGLALMGEALVESRSSTQAGRVLVARLLNERPGLDVIVFSNDDMAMGGIFHCLANGLQPRRDLGLFGFNGIDVGQALPMPLSTVRSDRFLIGRTAAEKVLARRTRPPTREVVDVGFELCEGETA